MCPVLANFSAGFFFRVALNSYEAQQRRFSLGSEMFNFRRVTPFILRSRPSAFKPKNRPLDRRRSRRGKMALNWANSKPLPPPFLRSMRAKRTKWAARGGRLPESSQASPGHTWGLRSRQATWLKKKSGAAAQEKSHGRFNERSEGTPTFLRKGKMPAIRGMRAMWWKKFDMQANMCVIETQSPRDSVCMCDGDCFSFPIPITNGILRISVNSMHNLTIG